MPPISKAARWFPFGPPGSELSVLNPPFLTQFCYVAIDGSDSDGDGSEARPFATIGKALDSIKDASGTKIYTIVISGGTFPENVVAKDFVWMVGTPFLTTVNTITINNVATVLIGVGVNGVTQHDGSLTCVLCEITTMTLDHAPPAFGASLVAKQGSINVLTATAGCQIYATGCPIFQVKLSGAATQLLTDSDSLPPTPAFITVTPPARILVQSGNALGLAYTPTVGADWKAPAPTTALEALDQVAARLTLGGL